MAISKFDDFIIVSKDLKEEHTFPSNSIAEFKTLTAPSKIGNLNESDLTLLSSDIIRIIGYFQIITNNYDGFKPWTRKHENVYINCSVIARFVRRRFSREHTSMSFSNLEEYMVLILSCFVVDD